jgi:hypothetical protein
VTIPRLLSMASYWAKSPPVHEVVMAIAKGFGLVNETKPAPDLAQAEESSQQFLRDFFAAGGQLADDVKAELAGVQQ